MKANKEIAISLVLKLNKKFLVAFFKSLDHFVVSLFLLITFDPILDDFVRFQTNSEIQDGGPRWPPFRNDYAIMTSLHHDADVKGDIFETYNLPSKSRWHSFYILGVTKESPRSEDQKKAGQNRVIGGLYSLI